MYSQEPAGYRCPFCSVVRGEENPAIETKPQDVVCRTPYTTAFIASRWWPHNAGHVLVVPNLHIENMYDLPQDLAGYIHELARQVALAMLEMYGCTGISTRQHNGRDGYQEVWHYHLHVFPRYPDDHLYELTTQRRSVTPEERLPYAEKLRAYFAKNPLDKLV